AILARGFALPLIALSDVTTEKITNRTEIVLDGPNGIVVVNPTDEEMTMVAEILARVPSVAAPAEPESLQTVTQDGVTIKLQINISDPAEADSVAQFGASGVGLFRTEFLYMDRLWWPSDDETLEIYRDVAHRVGGAELNIRLVDFGAEKCPPYADFPI